MENCKNCGHSSEVHDESGCNHHRQGAQMGCKCEKFLSPTLDAITGLSLQGQIIIACVHSLGLDHRLIFKADFTEGSGRHPADIEVVLRFSAEGQPLEWIKEKLPDDHRFVSLAVIEAVSDLLKNQ